jgi:HEAT repeat protein
LEYGSGLHHILAYGVLSMLGLVALMFMVLIMLRVLDTRRERRLIARKEQIRPVVDRLLAPDVAPSDALRTLKDVIPVPDLGVLELVLLEAARSPDGVMKKLTYITEEMGFVQADIDRLARARDTRRAESAFHLGIIRSKRAVGPLLEALESGTDQDVVFACLNALSHIGTPEAIEGVARYLASHRELENVRIAEVMLERPDEFAPYIRRWLEGGRVDARRLDFLLKVVGALGDTSMVEPASGYLGHADPQVRASTARALGLLGDRAACEPLVRAMSDSSAGVRTEAAEALGRIGCLQAHGVLEAGLGDPDISVRRNSAAALMLLGQVGHETLERFAATSEEGEREAAAEALEAEMVRNGTEGVKPDVSA